MLFPFPNRSAQPARVVVTGAGIVTALGIGWQANSDGFRQGTPAFRKVSLFDASQQRCQIAAQVDLPSELPPSRLGPHTRRRLNRSARMLVHAGLEAWTQSGWTPSEDIPIVLGTTGCGAESGESFFQESVQEPRARRGQATQIVQYQGQHQPIVMAEALGISGPITLISNACASGSNAVGHAWELVRSGQAERAIAGGYDALGRLVYAGFDALQALSAQPCRPFAKARDGLTLGEGAAILMLENLESATKRGAEILGEVIGYASTTDIHHLTQPHPEGDAALEAMRGACEIAGISAAEVSYVNAHGTGTILNDSAEAIALRKWRGGEIKSLKVSSTKASVGHLLGAAGAVEAVVCLMALRHQWMPPQLPSGELDPLCGFNVVREPLGAALEIVMSNSFGFGGANATLLFRRWR